MLLSNRKFIYLELSVILMRKKLNKVSVVIIFIIFINKLVFHSFTFKIDCITRLSVTSFFPGLSYFSVTVPLGIPLILQKIVKDFSHCLLSILT